MDSLLDVPESELFDMYTTYTEEMNEMGELRLKVVRRSDIEAVITNMLTELNWIQRVYLWKVTPGKYQQVLCDVFRKILWLNFCDFFYRISAIRKISY